MADLQLAIRLTADGKGLVGEVRVSREELEKLKKTTEDGAGASKQAAEAGGRHGAALETMQRSARAAVLTIGALTTAIALQTKRWIDDAASMERWHQVTGKSVESLAALKYVAEQTSVSFDMLMATYQRLPKSIVEGLGEGSEAGRAFKALMIDPRQLKANDEGMMLIIERLRQVEDRGTRAAIAQMIFKQRGEDLLLWVNQGAEGIRRLTQEGERWATVTGEDAKRADDLKNKINTLTYATDALAKSVADDVIPQLNTMIERMLEGARAGGGLRGAIAGFLTGSDLDKWNADFFRAVERLGAAQTNVERLQASGGWMRQGLKRAQDELNAAQAEVARLQAIKPIMFPETPPAGAAPGAAGGGAIRQPRLADLEPPDTSGMGLIRSLKDELAGFDLQATTVDRVMRQLTDGTQNYTQANRDAALAIAAEIDLRKQQKIELDAYLESARMEAELQQEVADVQARQQDKLNAAVEAIKQQNMTENELIQVHLDEQLAILNQARAMDLINEQQYEEQRYLLKVQAQAKLGDVAAQGVLARRRFEELNEQGKVQFVLGQMSQMLSGVATFSRALFNIHKVAALSEMAISLPKGVEKTFDAYPWPWNIIPAGIHLLTGLARIAQVAGTSFGGASSPSTVGGGGAVPVFPAPGSESATAPPSLPVAAAPRTKVDVIVEGPLTTPVTYQQIIDEIVPGLQMAFDNGADLTLTLRTT